MYSQLKQKELGVRQMQLRAHSKRWPVVLTEAVKQYLLSSQDTVLCFTPKIQLSSNARHSLMLL